MERRYKPIICPKCKEQALAYRERETFILCAICPKCSEEIDSA